MSGVLLTESDRARIVRLYDPRSTHGSRQLQNIGRLVGKSGQTVQKVLREAGLIREGQKRK